MKRFIYGFPAVIFAITAAAFTTSETSPAFTDAYFEFDYANYTPTIDNVQDETKWKRSFDMNGCADLNDRACKIRVSSAHYSGNSLSASVNIQAEESAADIA